MEDYKKTQWHPPFCAAVKLELRANKKDLSFEAEHTLNTKPIQIDLLVIKKLKDVDIQNEIGKIFKEHNIYEYKSPGDALGVDEYFKTLAYACLYKSNCPSTDSIKAEDITLTLVREGMPRELFKWFESNNSTIDEKYPGIYYVTGKKILFPTQVIVSSRLTVEEHQWLRALTSKMNEAIGEKLVLSAKGLSEKDDRDNADSVLQLALAENNELFKKLKEVPGMCEALTTLMKPELDAARADAENIGIAKGKTKGANELATAIKRLKTGSSAEDLISEGFDADIVKSAKDVLDDITK